MLPIGNVSHNVNVNKATENAYRVTLLSMDSFYKVLTQEQHEAAEQNEYNFDHPDAFDFELLIGWFLLLKSI